MIALFLVLRHRLSFLEPESWLVEDGHGLFIALGVVSAAALTVGAIVLLARRRSWWLFVAARRAVAPLIGEGR